MKPKILYLIITVGLLIVAGCRVRDIRTVEIAVPQLRGEECAQILHRALAGLGGVDPQSLHFDHGKVMVTYDSMKLALKNIEYAIAAQGFQANEVPADPAARNALPERCQ